MRRLVLLPVLVCWGCGMASSPPGSSAEATATANASTASAKPPEGAELETLIQSSIDFQKPLRYFVHHTGYAGGSELEAYRTLERNDYIRIDAETPEPRSGMPGAHVVVSLTDRGKALPGMQNGVANFGFPLAHQRVISAAFKERGSADGAYFYDVVFDWQSDDVGNLLESILPEKTKAPDGQFQVGVSLRKSSSSWLVREYARPVRIDR